MGNGFCCNVAHIIEALLLVKKEKEKGCIMNESIINLSLIPHLGLTFTLIVPKKKIRFNIYMLIISIIFIKF